MDIRIKLETDVEGKKIISIIELALLGYCWGMEVDEFDTIEYEKQVRVDEIMKVNENTPVSADYIYGRLRWIKEKL